MILWLTPGSNVQSRRIHRKQHSVQLVITTRQPNALIQQNAGEGETTIYAFCSYLSLLAATSHVKKTSLYIMLTNLCLLKVVSVAAIIKKEAKNQGKRTVIKHMQIIIEH